MCVRVDSMQVCVYVRVFARAAGAATQPEVATSSYVSLYVHIYVGMFEPICICKRAYIEYMSARMCV